MAAAVAAKSPGVDRPVVDPKPASSPAAKETAKPDATRDAPVPLADGARCMAEGRPPDRDGRRRALTDKVPGNGTTQAPAEKKQGDRLVSHPTREGQRQGPTTATPRRQAERHGSIEPPPLRTNSSSKPGKTLPGGRESMAPARSEENDLESPLAHILSLVRRVYASQARREVALLARYLNKTFTDEPTGCRPRNATMSDNLLETKGCQVNCIYGGGSAA